MATIGELTKYANQILKNQGIQSFSLDTQLLLAHALDKSKMFVLTHPEWEVEDRTVFDRLLARRAKFEPMAYVLGSCEFMSLDFMVTPDVLIPRPDTEVLVEQVAEWTGGRPCRILDIGTGSGCIGVSLLHLCPNAQVTAVDISPAALAVALQNARRHGVEGRFAPLQMDILQEFPAQTFDVVVSNPPYIAPDVIATLMPDVRDFEPYGALYGGEDGLAFYRAITKAAKAHLHPGGLLAYEVGHTQSGQVMELLQKNGYQKVAVVADLSGVLRVVMGQTV